MIDADPVAGAVQAMMQSRTERTEWMGNATDLLGALGEVVGERVTKSRSWPESPRSLSGRLRRAATFLRKIGINIRFEREGRARTRTIVITTTDDAALENDGTRPSAPSASSASNPKSNPVSGFAPLDLRTVGDNTDGRDGGPASTVRANSLKANEETAADDEDANTAPRSAACREEQAAIEERAALAADSVPACYADAWARLNHQKPANVTESRWRLALGDGGRFLDAWGDEAAELGWTAGDLFEVLFGLVWRLVGERVEALGPDDAELSDGRVIGREWV